jgi:hypothetical protein
VHRIRESRVLKAVENWLTCGLSYAEVKERMDGGRKKETETNKERHMNTPVMITAHSLTGPKCLLRLCVETISRQRDVHRLPLLL